MLFFPEHGKKPHVYSMYCSLIRMDALFNYCIAAMCLEYASSL